MDNGMDYGRYRLSRRRPWTDKSTMRQINGCVFKVIFKNNITRSSYFVSFVKCPNFLLSFRVYFVLSILPQTVFFAFIFLYMCKYFITHVETSNHTIPVYTYRVTLQLSILPGNIYLLIWVYLHRLIVHFTASLILDLPAFTPWYNIPVKYLGLCLLYASLSVRRYFIEQCNSALRVDLYNIRSMWHFNLWVSAVWCLFFSVFLQLGIFVLWKNFILTFLVFSILTSVNLMLFYKLIFSKLHLTCSAFMYIRIDVLRPFVVCSFIRFYCY